MFTKLSKQHTYTSLVTKNLPFSDDVKFKAMESYLSKKNTLLRTPEQDLVKFDLYSAEKIALAKASIIKKAKYMSEQSLTAGSGGNISMKIGNRILITTAGSRFSELTDDDICMVDLKGKVIDCAKGQKPSSELPLHLEAYNKRSDVGAVIHCHPTYASIYAVANKTMLPNILPHTTKHFSNLKVVKYENAGSKTLASNTIKALGNDEGETNIEEERRLCYVGITRAMETLYITRARNRLRRDKHNHAEASRFLGELQYGAAFKFNKGKTNNTFTNKNGNYADYIKNTTNSEKKEYNNSNAVFSPSEKVVHSVFGEGVVLFSEGSNEHEKVTVHFKKAGIKKIIAKFLEHA